MALDILIVDDEEDIRDLVAGVLEDEGFSTRTAANSDSAIDALDARRPSLVLLDVWLQGSRMDGLELLDEAVGGRQEGARPDARRQADPRGVVGGGRERGGVGRIADDVAKHARVDGVRRGRLGEFIRSWGTFQGLVVGTRRHEETGDEEAGGGDEWGCDHDAPGRPVDRACCVKNAQAERDPVP